MKECFLPPESGGSDKHTPLEVPLLTRRDRLTEEARWVVRAKDGGGGNDRLSLLPGQMEERAGRICHSRSIRE